VIFAFGDKGGKFFLLCGHIRNYAYIEVKHKKSWLIKLYVCRFNVAVAYVALCQSLYILDTIKETLYVVTYVVASIRVRIEKCWADAEYAI
jgi:ribosomal protein L20